MLKKLAIAVPLLIIAGFAALFIAFKFVDDKFIEAQTLKQLESTLNRKVTIDGQFSLTRTAHPTLRASNIRIASASWDPNNFLIDAEDITIQVDALPLLFGIINFEDIVFEKTTFNIVRNKEGDSNLNFGGTQSKTRSTPIHTPKIDRVEMIDLIINYDDWANNTKLHINTKKLSAVAIDEKNIKLNVVSQVDDQTVEISSEMCRLSHLFGSEDCTIDAQINTPPFKINVSGEIDLEEEGYINMPINIVGDNINELKLPFKTHIPDTNSAQASFTLLGQLNSIQLTKLKSNLKFDGATASVSGEIKSLNSLSGVQLKFYSEGTEGNWLNMYQDAFPGELIDHYTLALELENHEKDWKLDDIEASVKIDDTTLFGKGEIVISEGPIDLNLNINGRGKHPEWLDKLQDDINAKYIDDIRVDFDLVGEDSVWSIKNLESTVLTEDHTFNADGNISFSTDDKSTRVELDISSTGRNLYSLARIIKQNLPESKKFHIQSKLRYKQPTLSLTNTSVVIDGTSIKGNSEIDFVTPPNIRAELESKSLNIEHIIALTEDDTKKPPAEETEESKSLFSDEPLKLDWLNQANSNISLKVENIAYKEASLINLVAKLTAKNGIGNFKINSLFYSDAKLTADFKLDAKTSGHEYNIHTEGFNIGKFLQETEITDLLTGNIDFDLDLDTTGTTTRQLASNANGGFSVFMTNGSLDNAPIDLLATNLVKELLPGKKREDHTEIECFFAQFRGKDGLLKSEATLLNTRHIVMTANGDINLVKEEYDLTLIPKPKNISLFTLDSDILVTGPLNDPDFSISKGSLFKKVLQSAAVVALGPAALAVPFTTVGSSKYTECFKEVADTTTKAVNAQQKAQEEKEAEKKDDEPGKAKVESLNLEDL